MNRIAPLMILFAVSTGCASSTVLRSNPSGASVRNQYGRVICTTPCEYEDSEMVNHTESFTFEKDGYKPADINIKKDNFAARGVAFGIPAFVFPILWVGELWSFDYDESYRVELQKSDDNAIKLSEAHAE